MPLPQPTSTSPATRGMHRIQRVSGILHMLLSLLLPGLPLLMGLGWALVPDATVGASFGIFMGVGEGEELTLLDRGAGFIASLLPLSVILYGVWHLRALFGLYADGEILGTANAGRLRALAMTLILWLPAQFVGDAVISLALSIDNPPGERFIALNLSSNDFAITMIGAIALVISWVMVEAARAADDSASII
ncbi:DUF2975 domain-containing protein [Pyruvatibacter sp.]|uniref:DUF2975 domain-containing protein n=1 Tax=Pyruvatibacter sp. TaxID=1981328 RepID=UPI0032645CE0